jgi:hypothetical protein
MCSCTKNSFDILEKVNARRVKAGLSEVTYDWVLAKRWKHARFYKPYRKIGCNLIWTGTDAQRIVRAIWWIDYKPHYNYYKKAA